MSSYSFKNFLAEKYASSALKCRIGRPHTMPDKVFTVKSEIYMEKLQNLSECPLSGYPARLSTSYIYEVESPSGYPEMLDHGMFWSFSIYISLSTIKTLSGIV